MARTSSRSLDWGFPRWRGYGASSEATTVRTCDRHDCEAVGDRPAPKSPNNPDRWYFCERHAAEYNQGYNYFEGLDAEETAQREADMGRTASAYAASSHYGWGAAGDGTRSRDEMRAFAVLGLEGHESFDEARAAWRRLAKANHPDVKPNDVKAAEHFRAIQAAWEVIRTAEERRTAQ